MFLHFPVIFIVVAVIVVVLVVIVVDFDLVVVVTWGKQGHQNSSKVVNFLFCRV